MTLNIKFSVIRVRKRCVGQRIVEMLNGCYQTINKTTVIRFTNKYNHFLLVRRVEPDFMQKIRRQGSKYGQIFCYSIPYRYALGSFVVEKPNGAYQTVKQTETIPNTCNDVLSARWLEPQLMLKSATTIERCTHFHINLMAKIIQLRFRPKQEIVDTPEHNFGLNSFAVSHLSLM